MKQMIRNGSMFLLFATTIWTGGRTGSAQTYCGNQQSALLGNASQYQFQGNQWNRNFLTVKQCVAVTDSKQPPPGGPSAVNVGAAFHDTTGTPADYPYFLYGCFHRSCTRNTQLPIRVDALPQWSIASGVTVTQPAHATNDIAYDIWFTQAPQTAPDRNTDGTELMIWVQHLGFARPIGCCHPVLRFTDSHGIHWSAYAGYNKGNCADRCGPGVAGTQVISFLNDAGEQPTVNQGYVLDLNQFFQAALKAGQIQPSWYLQSIGFGTEIWVGGPGLAFNNYWVQVSPQSARHSAPH
jgi:hypothetical protein